MPEIEIDDLCIYYKEKSDSFDHEFGRTKINTFEVVNVQEFCETYGYKDITNTMSAEMQNKVDEIVERHICNNA
jgi:hypothetical protein